MQRIPEPVVFLKGIYDSDLNCKLILSGSSSLEIKSKIVEPLTGRKRVFYLSTVTFEEFLDFRDPEMALLDKNSLTYLTRVKFLFDEFVRFGAYPPVVIEESEERKVRILE